MYGYKNKNTLLRRSNFIDKGSDSHFIGALAEDGNTKLCFLSYANRSMAVDLHKKYSRYL